MFEIAAIAALIAMSHQTSEPVPGNTVQIAMVLPVEIDLQEKHSGQLGGIGDWPI